MEFEIDLADLQNAEARTRPLTAVVVRELEEADVALLAERGSADTARQPLKKISQRHHALARNIASGMPDGEAAIVCGYTASRVSILKGDPAFQELIQFYSEDIDAQYADLHERLSALSMDAAEELLERLESDPEKISTAQLLEIVKSGADRTGHGPSSTQNVNHNVDIASRLANAIKRTEERQIEDRAMKTVKELDLTPIPPKDHDFV